MARMFEIPEEHIENVMNYYRHSDIQRSVCEEECSELIKALTKYNRCAMLGGEEFAENSVRDSIVEELTHVAICLGILIKMFNISHDEIETEVRKKAENVGFDTSNYSWLRRHGGIFEIPKYVTDENGNVVLSPEWKSAMQKRASEEYPFLSQLLVGDYHAGES